MTETGPDRSFERLFFLGGRVIRNSKGELELAQNGVDGGPLYTDLRLKGGIVAISDRTKTHRAQSMCVVGTTDEVEFFLSEFNKHSGIGVTLSVLVSSEANTQGNLKSIERGLRKEDQSSLTKVGILTNQYHIERVRKMWSQISAQSMDYIAAENILVRNSDDPAACRAYIEKILRSQDFQKRQRLEQQGVEDLNGTEGRGYIPLTT